MDVFICGICHGEFNDIVKFMDHKKSLGAFSCSQCGALYHTEEDVQQHASKEHIIGIDPNDTSQTQVILETADSILIPQETAAEEYLATEATPQVASMALDELGNVTFVPDNDGNIRLMGNIQIVQSNRTAPTVVTLTPAQAERENICGVSDGSEQTVLTFQSGGIATQVTETEAVFDELTNVNQSYTVAVPTEDGSTESLVINCDPQIFELPKTDVQSDSSKGSVQVKGIFACSLCHCFALTQDDIIKHLQTVHKLPESTDRKEAMNLFTRLEPLEGSPMMVSKSSEQNNQESRNNIKDSLKILPIKNKDVPKTSAIHLIVEATGKCNSVSTEENSTPKRKRGRPRKNEQKNAAKESSSANQEDETTAPNPPSPPQQGPDGFYHCYQCKRSFKKDRHLLRHKCLGKGDYIDLTQKEDLSSTEADKPPHLKENDEEAEVDTDITEDFKIYMPVDFPPWSRGGRGGRGKSRGRGRGRGRGAKRLCIRETEVLATNTEDNEKESNDGNKENQGSIIIFIEGSEKLENEKDSASEEIQNSSEDGKPKLNWRDDPHHVPVFNSEKERVTFDEHLNSVDLSCVDHLYTRHEVAQDINTEQLGKWTGRESRELLVFSCNVCKKVFKSLSHMRLHCLIHTTLKPFQCPRCTYRSNAKGNLYTHMRKHTGNYFKCSHCSFHSCNRSHLAEHEATHTSVRHQCKLCNNDYNTVKSLMNHVRKYHNGPLGRRYLSSFLAKSQMYMAVLHICHVCNRKFKKKIDRDRHLFVHNIRDSPNILHCQLCDYTAARRSYLDNHYRKHRLIYVCCLCSEHFLSSVKLRHHLKGHLNFSTEQSKVSDHKNTNLPRAEGSQNETNSDEADMSSKGNIENNKCILEVNRATNDDERNKNPCDSSAIHNESITSFLQPNKSCSDNINFDPEDEEELPSSNNDDNNNNNNSNNDDDISSGNTDIQKGNENCSKLSSLTALCSPDLNNGLENVPEKCAAIPLSKSHTHLVDETTSHQNSQKINLQSMTSESSLHSLTQTLCHQAEIQDILSTSPQEAVIQGNNSLFSSLHSKQNCEESDLYNQQNPTIISLQSQQNNNKTDDLLCVVNGESSENKCSVSNETVSGQVRCVQENVSLLNVLNGAEQCENNSDDVNSENHLCHQHQLNLPNDISLQSHQHNNQKTNILTAVQLDKSSENTPLYNENVLNQEQYAHKNISLLNVLNSNEQCQTTTTTEMDTSETDLCNQQQSSDDSAFQSQQNNQRNDLISTVHSDEYSRNAHSISNDNVSSQVSFVNKNLSLVPVTNSSEHCENVPSEMDTDENNLFGNQQSDMEVNITLHCQESNSQNNNNILSDAHIDESSVNTTSISNETASDQTTNDFSTTSKNTLDSLFDNSLSVSWYLPEPDGSLALNQYVNIPEELTEGQNEQTKSREEATTNGEEEEEDEEEEEEEEETNQVQDIQPEEDSDQKRQYNLKYILSLNYKPLSLELYNKIRETFGQTECEACGRLFHSRLDLEPHLLTHAENKPFKCEKCPYSAATKDNLKRHQETVHEKRTFPCDQCEYVASSRTLLWHHRQKHLMTAVICQICDQTFSTPRSLRDHVLSKHPQVDRTELQKMLGANHRVIGRLGRRSYKCPYCERVFHRSSTDLQKHIWIHEGVKPYKCPLCSHTSRCRNNLNVHMLTHTAEKPHLCEECGKSYKSKTALRSHIRTHTEGSTFNCDQCDYSSSQKCQLKKHSETHEAVYLYTCNHCDYSSSILGYMKVHYARRHKGETFDESAITSEPLNTETLSMYKCLQCSQIFGSIAEMKNHLKDHCTQHQNGEILNENSIVSEAINTESLNLYKCLSCSHVFGNLLEMKNHLKVQHDICVDDVDFTSEETVPLHSEETEIIPTNEEELQNVTVSESLSEGIQMVQLQEAAAVSNILPTSLQEMHLANLREGEVDEKMASTVNIIQQIIEQGALGSQVTLQSLDGQSLVAVNPETIIVQEDGQEVLLNGSSTEGSYVIQYVTHMPSTSVDGEMTIHTSDIVENCDEDNNRDTLESFQVHYNSAVEVKSESNKNNCFENEDNEVIIQTTDLHESNL